MSIIDKYEIDFSYFVVPFLSLIATGVVFYKSCIDYSVVSSASPNFLLAIFSAFPYFLTFGLSFFAKTPTHRKSFYAILGILVFMTAFEWLGPKTSEMKNLYSVVWFIQTMFLIPFLFYVLKENR